MILGDTKSLEASNGIFKQIELIMDDNTRFSSFLFNFLAIMCFKQFYFDIDMLHALLISLPSIPYSFTFSAIEMESYDTCMDSNNVNDRFCIS